MNHYAAPIPLIWVIVFAQSDSSGTSEWDNIIRLAWMGAGALLSGGIMWKAHLYAKEQTRQETKRSIERALLKAKLEAIEASLEKTIKIGDCDYRMRQFGEDLKNNDK